MHGVPQESIGKFVRNSYDSSDDINQIVWTLDKDYESVLEYTKGLIELRRETDAFRLADAKKIKENTVLLSDNENKSLVFAYRIRNNNEDWIVIANASNKKATVKSDVSLKNAEVLVDSENAGTKAIPSPIVIIHGGKKITGEPLTASIIRVRK